jgi:hypothetical protein
VSASPAAHTGRPLSGCGGPPDRGSIRLDAGTFAHSAASGNSDEDTGEDLSRPTNGGLLKPREISPFAPPRLIRALSEACCAIG